MKTSDHALRAAIERARGTSKGAKLDASTFASVRDVIEEESGIAFDDASRFIVERRLQSRLRALRLNGFEEYVQRVRLGADADAERARLVEAVAVRETYFFREWPQLESFRDELLPQLAAENAERRELRIWSAGCATGEEPYSIAILLRESGRFDGWRVRILGTDLVASAIAAARRARYRDASLRATPEPLRERYLCPEGKHAWRLDERIRCAVDFEAANLLDERTCAGEPPFDVVFCRNVLMYFGEPARERVSNLLFERLRPGGRLLLGHAESLLTLDTPFALERIGRDFVYVR